MLVRMMVRCEVGEGNFNSEVQSPDWGYRIEAERTYYGTSGLRDEFL